MSRERNKVVDKMISATNAGRAAYGAIAYKQELYDGIKLMSEVNRINQFDSILNKQGFEVDLKI